MSNMNDIKRHFEEEAQQYDSNIRNLIPHYDQMVEAVVNAISFNCSAAIDVIDLGCGTGTIARSVKNTFPKARITCLDIADNMLQMAQFKLSDAPDTEYINDDFYRFSFDKQYDVVVSSLALHHLVTPDDKSDFYKKIYSGLKSGGMLVNADSVLASTETLQNMYMQQWKSFMYKNVSEREVESKWIPKYYEEDRPASLIEHLDMLREIGFAAVDVIWKYYNYAVFAAMKH